MKVSVDYQSPECIKMAGYIYLFSDVSNILVIKFYFPHYSPVKHLWWSFLTKIVNDYPTGIYLLQVNKRNTRTRREICSKLTIKTPCWLWICNCRLGRYMKFLRTSLRIEEHVPFLHQRAAKMIQLKL